MLVGDSIDDLLVVQRILEKAFRQFPRVVLSACLQSVKGTDRELYKAALLFFDNHLLNEPAAGITRCGSLETPTAAAAAGERADAHAAASCGPGMGNGIAAPKRQCLASEVLSTLPDTQAWLRQAIVTISKGGAGLHGGGGPMLRLCHSGMRVTDVHAAERMGVRMQRHSLRLNGTVSRTSCGAVSAGPCLTPGACPTGRRQAHPASQGDPCAHGQAAEDGDPAPSSVAPSSSPIAITAPYRRLGSGPDVAAAQAPLSHGGGYPQPCPACAAAAAAAASLAAPAVAGGRAGAVAGAVGQRDAAQRRGGQGEVGAQLGRCWRLAWHVCAGVCAGTCVLAWDVLSCAVRSARAGAGNLACVAPGGLCAVLTSSCQRADRGPCLHTGGAYCILR